MDSLKEAIELAESLGFPSQDEVKRENKKLVFDRSWGVVGEIYNIKRMLPEDTYQHSLRTAIKVVKVIRYLGIGKAEVSPRGNAEQAVFLAGLNHDLGKAWPDIKKITEKSEEIARNGGEFTKADREKMKEHGWGMLDDPFIKGIIVRVHSYQKDPYPKIPFLNYNSDRFGERSPEVEYLSRRFAFVDANDASLTRKFGNNGNQRYLTPEEARNSLIEVFGELNISYKGKMLPRVKQKGRDLINILYEEKIFGTP